MLLVLVVEEEGKGEEKLVARRVPPLRLCLRSGARRRLRSMLLVVVVEEEREGEEKVVARRVPPLRLCLRSGARRRLCSMLLVLLVEEGEKERAVARRRVLRLCRPCQ